MNRSGRLTRRGRSQDRPAFTLIELLVVLAIMAILTGLLASAVMRVRAAAARAVCADRLKQIGLALHNYHGQHQSFPSGVTIDDGVTPYPWMGWHTRILPYLEQDGLWRLSLEAYSVERNFGLPPHPLDRVVPAFECPSDPDSGRVGDWYGLRVGLTSFLGVEGVNSFRRDGVFFGDSRVRLTDITDGTSNTLMVGERPSFVRFSYGWWYASGGYDFRGSGSSILGVWDRNYFVQASDCPIGPYEFGPGRMDNKCDTFHFWSLHPGGAHFAFADGSVRFLSYGARPIMPALATRAGGEVVSPPD